MDAPRLSTSLSDLARNIGSNFQPMMSPRELEEQRALFIDSGIVEFDSNMSEEMFDRSEYY